MTRETEDHDEKKELQILVRENMDRVYNLSLRLTGNREEAREMVQDVFLKVCKSYRKFRGEADVSTWIYRIVINTHKNRVRWRLRKPLFPFPFAMGRDEEEEIPFEFPDPAGEAGNPVNVARLMEMREKLMNALGSLKEEEMRLIILRDMEGLSYEEISKVLGKPIGTIKSGISRARDSLRKRVRDLKE